MKRVKCLVLTRDSSRDPVFISGGYFMVSAAPWCLISPGGQSIVPSRGEGQGIVSSMLVHLQAATDLREGGVDGGSPCRMLITKIDKGRHQNSLPLITNYSQKFTQQYKWISLVGDLCRHFTKLAWPSVYKHCIVI